MAHAEVGGCIGSCPVYLNLLIVDLFLSSIGGVIGRLDAILAGLTIIRVSTFDLGPVLVSKSVAHSSKSNQWFFRLPLVECILSISHPGLRIEFVCNLVIDGCFDFSIQSESGRIYLYPRNSSPTYLYNVGIPVLPQLQLAIVHFVTPPKLVHQKHSIICIQPIDLGQSFGGFELFSVSRYPQVGLVYRPSFAQGWGIY